MFGHEKKSSVQEMIIILTTSILSYIVSKYYW